VGMNRQPHMYSIRDVPTNKHLKEKGISLVNKYAGIKSQIRELRDQEVALQEELELIEEAAIEHARRADVTNITGDEHMLRAKAEKVLKFPGSGDEWREKLEPVRKGCGDKGAGVNAECCASQRS